MAASIIIWIYSSQRTADIAKLCCENAELLISLNREEIIKSQSIDIYSMDLEASEEFDKKCHSIDNEEYKIELLPENEQSDAHMSDFIGVYSKEYKLWLLIKQTQIIPYDDLEGSNTSYYHLCKPNYEKPTLIGMHTNL